MLKTILKTDGQWTTALLRIALGIVIFPHGAQKLLGWFGGPGVDGTLGFFGSLGIPAILAYLVIAVEFLGGLGLIVGLLSRVAALGVIATMLGAIFLVNLSNGFFWTNGGYEFPLLIIAVAVAVLVRGSGPLSLDGLLGASATKG